MTMDITSVYVYMKKKMTNILASYGVWIMGNYVEAGYEHAKKSKIFYLITDYHLTINKYLI